jgi:hypothetical protein
MSEIDPPADELPKLSPGERRLYIAIAIIVAVIIFSPLVIPLWKHLHPSQVELAEQHEEFLEKNGASPDDICAAKRAVQLAYEQAEDSKGYQDAKLYADVYCSNVELGRRLDAY